MVRGEVVVWFLWLIRSRNGMVRLKGVRGREANEERKRMFGRCMLWLTHVIQCDKSLQ